LILPCAYSIHTCARAARQPARSLARCAASQLPSKRIDTQ